MAGRHDTFELHPGLRDELDKNFKPIFDKHEETGGIPLRILRKRLEQEGATEHFPPERLNYLLRKADQDRDGHLNYEEFVRVVTTRETPILSRTELTRFQKLVQASVSWVVPRNARNRAGSYVVDDYISQYNCRPPPIFMIVISIVEVFVFIAYVIELKGTNYEVTATSGIPMNSPFIYNPQRRYEVWRYFSYMLLHQGYVHLIFNMIFQLFLGLPLEMVHKWWRVGIIYMLGVIAGSLGHSLADRNTFLAGASGGCYALIGAHFAVVIMNWKEMTHDWLSGPLRFLLSAPVRLIIWTLLAGVDTGMSIYNRYQHAAANVGYTSHFAGALAGLLIGIPVLKNLDKKPWERIAWWVALIIYLLAVIFAILWNALYPGFPESDWRKCCPMPEF